MSSLISLNPLIPGTGRPLNLPPSPQPIRLKKKLFVSCNGREKNRVGKSVKKKICIIFLVKNVCFMHVLRWLGVGRAEKILG